jgi:hypothetical protein
MTTPNTPATPTTRDTGASLVRTYVALAVGVFLTWLARRFNVVLDADSSQALAFGVTGVVTAVYYTVVRLLESKSKVFGWFLGLARQPKYIDAATARTLDGQVVVERPVQSRP